MGENNRFRFNRIAIFTGILVLSSVFFFLVDRSGDKGGGDAGGPDEEGTISSPETSRARITELAAAPTQQTEIAALSRNFYTPPRTRRKPDGSGRFPAVTEPVEGIVEPLEVALNYLRSGAPPEDGWTVEDLADPKVMSQVASGKSGVTALHFRQSVDGIEVYNGNLNVNIAKDGSILSVHNSFVKDARARIRSRAAKLTARRAIETAAEQLQVEFAGAGRLAKMEGPIGVARETIFAGGELSHDPIPAKLVYLARENGETRLAWNLVLHLKDGVRWLDLNVDAEDGRLLSQVNWYASAGYRVFALPKESPSDGGRTLETDPHDPAASPFGWHDTDGVAGADFTDTRGNNVEAQEDADADNSGGRRPDGGPGLIFDNPVDLTQEPAAYEAAAVTNLFYWNNLIHDVLWRHGFDEAAGNFQANNYGNGGMGGDPVQADAQDGTGTNNANFGTPPDGQSPRMQMFLWTYTTPSRHSSFENETIVHEYGHGLSHRLTGGPASSSALALSQSRGMGEGWGDWLALVFTAVPGDTTVTPRGNGTYLLGEPLDGPGLRPYRYSTDLSENPLTYGILATRTLAEPHGIGTVWATVLWEVYWELVAAHGWDPDLHASNGGNTMALDLVIEGMKLQPVNPSYLDARDAIVLADQVMHGGANVDRIWAAFAKRGMGFNADDGGGAGSLDVTEAFDLPDELLTIDSVSVVEGNSGTVTATFTVSLDPASPDEEIRVDYAVVDGSAMAPGDYSTVGGPLIFPAGSASQTIEVTVNGDILPEEDETFRVELSNAINGRIKEGVGVGTILNDDYVPPSIIGPLSTTAIDGHPFTFTIAAADTPRTYSISGEPPGMTVNAATGVISWLPLGTGNFTTELTVANPAGSDTDTLSIDVMENDFLTALDVRGLPVSTGGGAWTDQSSMSFDGVDAVHSGPVGSDGISWMELTVDGPDTVSFWWKMKGGFFDRLRLLVDGNVEREISDDGGAWIKAEIDLGPGTHTLRWEYQSYPGATDAWVDELRLESDPRPLITSFSKAVGATGQEFSYQVTTTKPATSFSSGPLPDGLSLDPDTGLISGIPATAGLTPVVITAANGAGSEKRSVVIRITESARFPFFEDFESGAIAPWWSVTGTSNFRTEVTQDHGPRRGSWHLTMDDTRSGGERARNEFTLTVDLAGKRDVLLSFWAKDFGKFPGNFRPSPFFDGADFNGVAISADGFNWYEVISLQSEFPEWTHIGLDLDEAIRRHGLAYDSAFKIRFNHYGNFPIDPFFGNGTALDDIRVFSGTDCQPDVRLGKSPNPKQHMGNGLHYAGFGSGLQGNRMRQRIDVRSGRNGKANFYVSVQNDGKLPDHIAVVMSTSSRVGFPRVEIFERANGRRRNITGEITRGQYRRDHEVSQVRKLKVEMRLRKSRASRVWIMVKAKSVGAPSKADVGTVLVLPPR